MNTKSKKDGIRPRCERRKESRMIPSIWKDRVFLNQDCGSVMSGKERGGSGVWFWLC